MDSTPKSPKLRRDSIASFAFNPSIAQGAAAPRASSIAPGSIAALVFRHVSSSRSVRGILAGAFVATTLVSALAVSSSVRPEAVVASEPEPMRIEQLIELTPPAPEPEPPPPARPLPRTASHRLKTRKPLEKPDAPGARPPPPAQAGRLVATEPDDPLDFTEKSMVSADNARFAGGVTAPSGTNQEAVRTSTVDFNAKPGGPQGEGSLARPVGLSARNWHCPWPEEAEMLGITEQIVVIRVVADAAGVSKKVTVLADPGHGFGSAAVTCARVYKFDPALDDYGRSYAATSPPIRVRFTR